MKDKQNVNKLKGKTVPIFPSQKFIKLKRASLRHRRSKGKHLGKLSVKIIHFTIKQSFKAIKSLTSLYLPYPNPGAIGAMYFYNLSSMSKTLINLLLQIGNLELNPGPESNHQITKKAISIVTYNCNGLGERKKLKRVMDKVAGITNKGGIVMLQETHLTDEKLIPQYFKGNFKLNGFKSNSAGVLTLLGDDFEEIFSHSDEQGRQLYTVVNRKDEKYLIANVYCPNDHKQNIDFIDKVYSKILEILNSYPDCFVVLGGDFNSCATELDYLNRVKLKSEEELTKLIAQCNDMCELTDSYRVVRKDPGFTWNRGDCYSRLDYLFISNGLVSRIVNSRVDWAFEKSDHAALITTIKLNPEISKGPGILKVNPIILNDPQKLEQVRSDLNFLINQIPNHWNGHVKLDYLKMIIRSTIGKFTGINRSELEESSSSLETSLNDIVILKQKILSASNKSSSSSEETEKHRARVGKVEVAFQSITNELETTRRKLEHSRAFNLAAKWYEYGEKSNKFFLNLNKFR